MVHFEGDYLPALAGLLLGALAGLVLTAVGRRSEIARRLSDWDARLTAPLLVAAAGAHLALLPVVERQRVVLFSIYAIALLLTVAAGIAGQWAWRVGAVALPAGSILAYAYFAVLAHEADVVGLVIKAAEVAAIAAALTPVVRGRAARSRLTVT